MKSLPSTALARPRARPVAAPRQRRKEARPQELLEAALELFVERGFAATRAEDVAARAGVSKGTLYLYYPSKEELLKEVIRAHVINQIAEGEDLISRFEGTTIELLALVLRLWWERIGETRASGIIKLMTSEVRNFPEVAQFYVDEVIAPSNRLLAQVIERGVDRGEFRAIDVAETVHALVGPLVFLVLNKHSLGACSVRYQLEPKAVIAALLDMVIHGLVPRTGPAARRRGR
jgi:TetR/AcrR family transcriptional regulator